MKTKVNTMRAAGINFMHFRQLGEDGKPLPYGGLTVAYKLEELSNPRHTSKIIHAASRCRNDEETGKRDNFNRKVGAAIAGGRVLAYINSHGANKCASESGGFESLDQFRTYIAQNVKEHYGLVRDFHISKKDKEEVVQALLSHVPF